MANNEYVNKVIYGNQTLIDISDTTANENTVADGEVFYKASGERSTGTANYVKTLTFNGTTNQPDANNDISVSETDPTVPSWAKAVNKPTYTASEVGALPNPLQLNGVDLSKANNDISAQTNGSLEVVDKNGVMIGQVMVSAFPDGSTAIGIYATNKTNGTLYTSGIRVYKDKEANGSYNVSQPDKFRDAISVYSKTEIDNRVSTLEEMRTYLGIT